MQINQECLTYQLYDRKIEKISSTLTYQLYNKKIESNANVQRIYTKITNTVGNTCISNALPLSLAGNS